MGIDDKVQETVGKAKEGVGEAVGNEDLRQEGAKDRVEANVKEMFDQAKEKVGDAASNLADKVEALKDKVTGEHKQ